MISGIEFYREISPATRIYLFGRACKAAQEVNQKLGDTQEVSTPFIPSDITVGSMDIGGITLRGLEAVQYKLEIDKHNEPVRLTPHAKNFENDGELVEAVALAASRFTRARQVRIMNHALRAANILPELQLPDMQIVVARHMSEEPTDTNVPNFSGYVSTHVERSVGLAHLGALQARPIDDETVIHVQFRSAS